MYNLVQDGRSVLLAVKFLKTLTKYDRGIMLVEWEEVEVDWSWSRVTQNGGVFLAPIKPSKFLFKNKPMH